MLWFVVIWFLFLSMIVYLVFVGIFKLYEVWFGIMCFGGISCVVFFVFNCVVVLCILDVVLMVSLFVCNKVCWVFGEVGWIVLFRFWYFGNILM